MFTYKAASSNRVCSIGVSSCRPAMTSRRVLRPSAFTYGPNEKHVLLAKPQQERTSRLSMLSLISASVAIQAQTQRFERLAGRSAMIGVAVALVAELSTESSIFKHFSPETVAILSGLFMGAVSLAAAAAFASKRRLGMELLEAVVTSLTANQRSAASVTGRQVDTAVDNVLNKVFDTGVIFSILAQEDDI